MQMEFFRAHHKMGTYLYDAVDVAVELGNVDGGGEEGEEADGDGVQREAVLRAEVHVGDGDALHRVDQVEQVECALVGRRGLHVEEDARRIDGLEELDGVALLLDDALEVAEDVVEALLREHLVGAVELVGVALQVEVGRLQRQLHQLLTVVVPVHQDLEGLQHGQSHILVGRLKIDMKLVIL